MKNWSIPGILAGAVFGALFLVAASALAYATPPGYWVNSVMGVRLWDASDPGGAYLGSALHFFGPAQYPPFIGHPGTTLQILIWLVAAGSYALGGDISSFISYSAKNFYIISYHAQIVVAVLHLLCAVCVYHLSRHLFNAQSSGYLSGAVYLGSFPVLFYLVRLSVEPIMMLCILGSIGVLWASLERPERVNLYRALGYSAFAGALSGVGLLTKVQFFLPLTPVFLLLFVVPWRSRPGGAGVSVGSSDENENWFHSAAGRAIAFTVACLLVVGILGQKVDVPQFISFWRDFADTTRLPVFQAGTPQTQAQMAMIATALAPTFILGLFGLLRAWRAFPHARPRILSLLIVTAAITPIAIVRIEFHYWFVHVAVISMFAGYGITGVASKLVRGRGNSSIQRQIAIACLFGICLAGSLVLFYDTKMHDMREVAKLPLRQVRQALESTEIEDRIGLVMLKPGDFNFFILHGMYPRHVPPDLPVVRAFREQFRVVALEDDRRLSLNDCETMGVQALIDLRNGPPSLTLCPRNKR